MAKIEVSFTIDPGTAPLSLIQEIIQELKAMFESTGASAKSKAQIQIDFDDVKEDMKAVLESTEDGLYPQITQERLSDWIERLS